MRILYISNHNPHFANSNVFREEAICQLGHELLFFEDRAFSFPGRIRDSFEFVNDLDLNLLGKKLIKTIERTQPDICLFVGGGFFKQRTLKKIHKLDTKTVLWITDALADFYIDYIEQNANNFDHIFYAGTESEQLLNRLQHKNTSWLPFACNPRFHKPVTLTEEELTKYKKDIVFVGSHYPNREILLTSLSEFDIGIWGPFWSRVKESSPLYPSITDVRLNYTEWIKIYSAAKIVIVSHYNDGEMPCLQASPKIFEALACKSFVLVDCQKDAETLFEDQKHLVFFKDEKDLKEKIHYYINNENERNKIAQEGYNKVLTEDTYELRIKSLLNTIETT